jgi:photosystem II stability/assembly factor-like uncharacterized protein
MSKEFTILVGTVGNGIWRSTDGGKSFGGVRGISGLDLVVRGFGVDPHDPQHVIVGTGLGVTPYGLHESFDGGGSFAPVEAFDRIEAWRITFDPSTPGRYFVGTRPSAIYRTEDAGKSFEKLNVDLAPTCPAVQIPRVTSITIHPNEPSTILVSVEVDGVRRSLDGGDTWEQVMNNIETPVPNGQVYGPDGRMDCHFSGISVGDPDLFLVSTPDGVYQSDDSGKTWSDFVVKQNFPLQYHREFAIKLDDPNTIFQGVGEFVNGQEGAMQRTRDRGATWDTVELPDECNSPVWCFGQHKSDPNTIVACTHKGMLFGTEDGGETWTKFRREFSEVRGICWLPN